MCRCDLTAVQKSVTKEGPNKGRKFWTCPNSEKARCGFFAWDDEAGAEDSVRNVRPAPRNDREGGGGGGGSCFKWFAVLYFSQILILILFS
jgi:DNA topoisomerase-3